MANVTETAIGLFSIVASIYNPFSVNTLGIVLFFAEMFVVEIFVRKFCNCYFRLLVCHVHYILFVVSRGQPNDLCPIFGVSSGYLRDKCRYSLLQTKTAIPSISGITVSDRSIRKILLINHTLRDDAMDIYSVICY